MGRPLWPRASEFIHSHQRRDRGNNPLISFFIKLDIIGSLSTLPVWHPHVYVQNHATDCIEEPSLLTSLGSLSNASYNSYRRPLDYYYGYVNGRQYICKNRDQTCTLVFKTTMQKSICIIQIYSAVLYTGLVLD